jgi:hypothetical protein
MSGVTADNPYRASGVIAAAGAGGLSWQDIVTASTLTAEAGNGYWIDTTSNACTITLPSSASNGDEIMFADYARNWGTNGIELDSNGLNYQGDDDESTVEYGTDGQVVHIVYSGATQGWIPTLDKTVEDVPLAGNDNGIFAFGWTGSNTGVSNIVSSSGVVATDVAAVGTARAIPAACEYGGDKGIFAYGTSPGLTNISSLVSSSGVISADVSGVGTARGFVAACEYGTDKGIFGYGGVAGPTYYSTTNKVSNAGVVATDTSGVGTTRQAVAACGYGGDKGIFAYGNAATVMSISNLISNTGVQGADVSGVGQTRTSLAATQYGKDKGIFGFGTGAPSYTAVTNLVSNAGVVATDTSGVGTARADIGACSYN